MDQKRTDVNKLGEFGLIDHLTDRFEQRKESTIKAVGDDAAVIDNSTNKILISTDSLVEGIHFDLVYTPLKHLGYKSVVVNLSDICAMNGTPEQILVSIAISNKYSVEALEELYAGIESACKHYGVDLVGGDTTSSTKGLFLNITCVGRVEEGRICYRNGARPGDLICTSGDLGASYLGLQILEREKRLFLENPNLKPDIESHAYLVGRQLKPEARLDIVQYLNKSDIIPTAMIDISDGLSSELMHICKQSNVGALIEESKIPIHPDAEKMAIEFNMNPISCALSGGEDYELLFTADPGDLDKIRVMPDIFIIGEVTQPEKGAVLQTTGGILHKITAQGWKHFEA